MSLPTLYHFPEETNSFNLPEHGSRELINYVTTLTLNNDNVFGKAMYYLPDADSQLLLDLPGQFENEPQEVKLSRMKQSVVFMRLTNRICEFCGDKRDIRKLKICADCCISWYCSKDCQANHWPIHKQRCQQKNGPLDKGYQQLAFLDISK